MSAIIEAFIHICFDIDGITKVFPDSRGAFSAHENVYTTEGWAAHGDVYSTGA